MKKASLITLALIASATAFGDVKLETPESLKVDPYLSRQEMYRTTHSDPRAVDLLFQEGATIPSILDGLKEKGFHIDYKKNQVLPTMTLISLPKGTRIDEVLREILEPWNLNVHHSPYGEWIVRPTKKKAE